MTNNVSAMPAGKAAARGAAPGQSLKNAITAAVMTAILTIPILGLQLKLEGYKVVLEPHWRPVWIAVAAVFLFQLFKPLLSRAGSAVRLPGDRKSVV